MKKQSCTITVLMVLFQTSSTIDTLSVENLTESHFNKNYIVSNINDSDHKIATLSQKDWPTTTPNTQRGQIMACLGIFATLMIAGSTIQLEMILGYLKDLSIVKYGFLAKLYRELITVFLSIQWVQFSIVMVLIYENNDEFILKAFTAKLLCYSTTFLSFLLLLGLNGVSILKLYLLKQKVIDPPLPWNNDRCFDDIQMSKLRIRSLLVVGIFILILYGTGTFPRIFYIAIGDDHSLNHPPVATVALEVFNSILMCLYIFQTIALLIIERRNKSLMKNKIPLQLRFVLLAFLLIMGMIFFYGFLEGSGLIGNNVAAASMTVLGFGVTSPLCLIISSNPLRLFIKNNIKNSAICFNFSKTLEKCRQYLKKKSSAIHPIV